LKRSNRAHARTPNQFRLDVSVTPGNAREFDLWRSGMAPLFAMDSADSEARSSFGAQMTSYQFADVAIASGQASAATFERTAPLIARSGIDNIAVLVYTKGGCALDVEGRAAEVRAGDICFLDLSRPVNLRAPDYESLTLILPRAALAPSLADLDGLHGQVLQKSNPLNTILVNHLRTLFAQAPSLSAADGRAAAKGTAALIAAFADRRPTAVTPWLVPSPPRRCTRCGALSRRTFATWIWGRNSYAGSLVSHGRNFIGPLNRWAASATTSCSVG
jgi:hypothetical protein